MKIYKGKKTLQASAGLLSVRRNAGKDGTVYNTVAYFLGKAAGSLQIVASGDDSDPLQCATVRFDGKKRVVTAVEKDTFSAAFMIAAANSAVVNSLHAAIDQAAVGTVLEEDRTEAEADEAQPTKIEQAESAPAPKKTAKVVNGL